MDKNAILKFCKELGCCEACCLRYMGIKNPAAYENIKKFIHNFQTNSTEGQSEINESSDQEKSPNIEPESTDDVPMQNGEENSHEQETDAQSSPPAKRSKLDICVSCLGILQEASWDESFVMVQEQLNKKCYTCPTFACALSAPIATALRERAITLMLKDALPEYDAKAVTPLKEAWKWSFAARLAARTDKTLDSGAVSPLLITLSIEYPDDLQDLEILKTLSPSLFEERSKQKRRFTVEFTRRSVDQALEGVTLEALRRIEGWHTGVPCVHTPVKCVSVMCTHTPVYLGGRYIKLSRWLPQTPWLVNGVRMMESSVQEIIFEPIAKLYQMSPEEMEHRLKFMSAGREDVDVRCLGDGRPFAIEVTDPRRELTEEELRQVCEEISKDGKVIVKRMVHVTKDDLTQLKKGEESKCKTYDALCIKLTHGDHQHGEANGDTPIKVTQTDIDNINTYTNTPPDEEARIVLCQKTPIRVLHRRPLLVRRRRIYELKAAAVPDHPQLFTLRIRTEAGTYVKEFCHGEAARTRPALSHALRARADIVALDVTAVHLPWPNCTT